MSRKWDGVSFFIGILVGILITFIIGYLAYSGRVFIFSTCSTDIRVCRASDYYNLPSRAIANGYTADEIMDINDQGQLVYRRVPKDLCQPGSNQDIIIRYPQYCSFTTSSGLTFEAKSAGLASNMYSPTNGLGITITTEQNCVPVSSTSGNIVSGVPLVKWDAATEADI